LHTAKNHVSATKQHWVGLDFTPPKRVTSRFCKIIIASCYAIDKGNSKNA